MPTPQLRVMRRLHAPPPPSAWALVSLVLGSLFLWPLTGHAQSAGLGDLEQLARDQRLPWAAALALLPQLLLLLVLLLLPLLLL